MNKYAIYTDGLTYPVLEKDGQYYIGVPGTGHFSGQWKFLGVRERLKNSRTIIKPEDALKITDWKFKNGSPRYQVVDLDHGSVRTWAGTSADQQLRSFDTISDGGFNIATKTDKDEEIVLEESKKYAIYATYGGDGVYNSKLVDTVDSEEQAVDRVAELQATGVGASYEELTEAKTNDKLLTFKLNDSGYSVYGSHVICDEEILTIKDLKRDINSNWKKLNSSSNKGKSDTLKNELIKNLKTLINIIETKITSVEKSRDTGSPTDRKFIENRLYYLDVAKDNCLEALKKINNIAFYEEVEDKDNLNENKTFSNIRELGQYIENQVKKDFPNIAYVQSVEAFSNKDLDEFDIYLDIEDYNNENRSGQRPKKGKIEVKMYNDQIHLVVLVPGYFDISSQIWDKYGFHLDFDFNNVDQAIQCIKDICQYIETKNEIKEEDAFQASDIQADTTNKLILKKGHQYILGNKDSFIDKIDFYYPDRDNIINKIYNFLGDSENLVTVNLEDIDNIEETKSYQSSIYQYDNYVIDLMYYNSIPVAVGCVIDEEGYYDKNESYIILLNKDNIEIPLEEECSQASGVASGTNGKIDSFPINPKEMEKQRFKESIDNSSMQKDFERMNKMSDVDSIKDYLYEITMSQNYDEAKNTLIEYLKQAILDKNENIINATKYIIETSFGGLQGLEDFFSLTEAKEDKNIILNFINQCINSGKFNKEQINEIKYGFEDGLTLEQLKIYANPKFDNYQMYEIRWGFKDGLTLEQVKTYADSKISDSEMWNIREKLEGNYEKEDDSLFEALKELINYLNKNTKYNWDANEMYDNCAITESDTDYIEVFVDIKDGNKIYTVDNYSYNSLEELVKNMPVLFTDEDEDYDYDEGWEDEEEYQADKELDQKKTNKFNSEGPASFEHLKNLGIFDKKESKDLTKTLQEMALLEDYEENKTISPQKQKFIDYCKDKIEDLGDIEIYDEDYEENVQYHKIMHTEGIREFEDLYIVADFDNYENENLIAINNENKIVINTPMIDCNGYAGTMQFDKIDKKFYNQLMDYWDDIYMDEIIEEE